MKSLKSILMSCCCVLLLACDAGPTPEAQGSPEPGASALPLAAARKPKAPRAPQRPRIEPAPVQVQTTLSNGVPVTDLSGAYDSEQLWTFEVPPGATALVVTTDSGSGDADLYVRYGAPPLSMRSPTPAYDCLGFSTTTTENCTIPNPQPGTWYVMIHAWQAYSGVRLEAHYRMPTVLDSVDVGIEFSKPACTLVHVSGFPPECFNPFSAPSEPGLTLTYKVPTLGSGFVTGSAPIYSNVSSFILYNTRRNVTFAAATFEEIGITFPSGAPASACRDRLVISSSPLQASGWPQWSTAGGKTKVESGEAWGGIDFPTFNGVDVTADGALDYQHPCRTTVEFKAQ